MAPRATPAAGVTPGQAKRVFLDFLRNFRGPPSSDFPDGQLAYRDALDQDQPPRELTVMLEDVIAHDPDLAKELRARPEVYVPVLEQAAVATVESLRQQRNANPQEGDVVAGVGGSKDMFDTVQIQVHLGSDETPTALRSLSSKDVSRLVCVPGIVIAASRTKSKATRLAIQCKTCRSVKYLAMGAGFGGTVVPRICDQAAANPDASAEGGCGLDPYLVMPEKSKFADIQTLKMQENPEDVPAGEMPRNVTLCVTRNLVQKIVPGTRVKVLGRVHRGRRRRRQNPRRRRRRIERVAAVFERGRFIRGERRRARRPALLRRRALRVQAVRVQAVQRSHR
jgi:DNA replication licensing factor MCM5